MEQAQFCYYILPFKSFPIGYFYGIKRLLPFKQSLKEIIHLKSIPNSFRQLSFYLTKTPNSYVLFS